MKRLLYSPTWLTPDTRTVDVRTTSNGTVKHVKIKYSSHRGVITGAWEVPSIIDLTGTRQRVIDLLVDLEFLTHFRDDRGRRMPEETAACALVMNAHRTLKASVTGRTVKKLEDVMAEKIKYVEEDTVYEYTKTKLDKLFKTIFRRAECTVSEFTNLRNKEVNLVDGWLSTGHIDTFWETVKKESTPGSVTVDRFSRLDCPVVASERVNDITKLARGLKRGLRNHYVRKELACNYVALFPINNEGSHHTLARAEYHKDASLVVVTFFDSCDYPRLFFYRIICDVFHEAFKMARKDAELEAVFLDPALPITYEQRTGIMQKQVDSTNCGVFVCIAMLEAAGGEMPMIHERTIDEGDVRKVRCIIARNHKIALV